MSDKRIRITIKGGRGETFLNVVTLKGYWTDEKGKKIEKATFGSKVRFYFDPSQKQWSDMMYKTTLRISIWSGKEESLIVEDKVGVLMSDFKFDYVRERKCYWEGVLERPKNFKGNDFELWCCAVSAFCRCYLNGNIESILVRAY